MSKKTEKMKEDIKNLQNSSKEAFVEYINNITDKAQNYTAKQLEKIEKKTMEILDDTKSTINNNLK